VRCLIVKSSVLVYGLLLCDLVMFIEEIGFKVMLCVGFVKDFIEVEGYVCGFL